MSSDPESILAAEKLVLPGVGAFGNAMEALHERNLVSAIKDYAASGKPMLGICLGMQLLLDKSYEFGQTQGLGLISGNVVPIPNHSVEGDAQKVPNIGWCNLIAPDGQGWSYQILKHLNPEDAVYFVHSFMVEPADDANRIADYLYGGRRVAGIIGRENVIGCQFHPEKSGAIGLSVLRAFCDDIGPA